MMAMLRIDGVPFGMGRFRRGVSSMLADTSTSPLPAIAVTLPHVTFYLMRYLFSLLGSAALVLAWGDLSGRRAPGFSLPDLHARQHDLQDYHGKIVLVDIIQTTCPHCARLAEILERVHGKYGDKVA